MPDVVLITTSDGSHSLRNAEFDETYHSIHGAVQESEHVFIKNGLWDLENRPGDEVRILEVGFGTGLNALLTAQHASATGVRIHYTALEVFPLEEAIWRKLNYPALTGDESASLFFAGLHASSWDREEKMSPDFTLFKKLTSIQQWDPGVEKYDLVYFDAFAPAKQPEMWELPVLQKVEGVMNPGAVFVTYCAKGQLKRDLKSLGLEVTTLPGPPGKKEMVRAIKS